MAARKNPTPRRGIPALLKEVRKRYRELGIYNYAETCRHIDISEQAFSRIIRGKSTNVSNDTERKLREWLDDPRNAPPQVFSNGAEHTPSEDEKTVAQLLQDSIVDEMVALLPALSTDKLDHLRTRVAGHIDAALEQQAESADQLVSKLETDLANKDEFIRQMQGNGEAPPDSLTVANLQTMLRLSGEENTNLKEALKRVTQVL